MNVITRTFFALSLLSLFAVSSVAQQQAPPVPPQTPRQALIELANGGANAVMKHLTVEVQQLLKQPENKEALVALEMTPSIKSEMGQDVQLFDSGPVLASLNQPREHRKIEVQLNNDDMSGDQDTMDLSIHSFHDGVEQDEEWQMFLQHFTVTMIRQQNVWRLSKIGLGIEMAVGDPEFLKKTYLASMRGSGVGIVGAKIGPATTSDASQRPEMQPSQIVTLLGYSEQAFARQHVDVGFTCSLAELAQDTKLLGLDPQIASGSYKNYKISLTGCQGKPVGSFQILVEPLPGKGGQAYCTDATQNLRTADDGRGATCLSAGRAAQQATPSDDEDNADSTPVKDVVPEPKD